MDVKSYIKAARLRTLPLSVSGIIVGSSLGINSNITNTINSFLNTSLFENYSLFESAIFWLAILTTIGFQVVSNFANDYGDGINGTDAKRTGEERMVASGAISPKQMKLAVIVTAVITFCIALCLIYVAFGSDYIIYTLVFLVLGVAAIAAAIKYTVGNSAYGYSGYGDLFVFLFFGLLSVVGSYFLFTKEVEWTIFLPAFTVGMLSTAVLNLNNMRDRIEDEKSGKRTLVVKIGAEFAKYYHYYLIVGSMLFSLLFTSIHFKNPFQFLFLIAYVPLFIHLNKVYQNKNESELDGQLKIVALSTFLFAILFAIGQLMI